MQKIASEMSEYIKILERQEVHRAKFIARTKIEVIEMPHLETQPVVRTNGTMIELDVKKIFADNTNELEVFI